MSAKAEIPARPAVEIGLRPAPVGVEEAVEAVVRDRHRLDPAAPSRSSVISSL